MSECTLIYNTPLNSAAQAQFEQRLWRALTSIKKELGEGQLKDISVMLHNDAYVKTLNHSFRGMDKPTNVLSFPAQSMPGEVAADYLGDIAVSLETIEREAAEQEKDPVEHLTHMVVHGILHLLGYDHEDEAHASHMESLEINILRKIGIDNPYL